MLFVNEYTNIEFRMNSLISFQLADQVTDYCFIKEKLVRYV
jgi:hypothetical protein